MSPSWDGRLRKAELTPRDCATCGQIFVPIRRAKGIYCSRLCANAGIARESIDRRAEMLRGRGEGRTYRKRNGRHEHRVVAEQMLGRELREGEIVHHVDGDIHNNDPSNLEITTRQQHIHMHKPWLHWERKRAS